MINKVTIVGLLVVFVICSFCQKDFEVLNRHSCRCKEKLTNQRNEDSDDNYSVSNKCDTVNLAPNELLIRIVPSVFVVKYAKDFLVSKYYRDHVEQLHL